MNDEFIVDTSSFDSMRSTMDYMNRRSKEVRQSELASIKAAELASEQTNLLKEANAIALKAQQDAEQSKLDSVKASKRAFLSNLIAVASLVVAVISLAFSFYQVGT